MATVTYEALCPKGNRINVTAKELGRRLTEVVRILLDQEENSSPNVDRYRAEVATTKAQRDAADVSLQRHVAHCAEGCKRTPGGALAFASVNQAGVNSRAPSHQKPPMPGPGELAAQLRDGKTLDDLAVEHERSKGGLQTILNNAGFSARTGEPTTRASAVLLGFVRAEEQPWAGDALCAQTDPESFYPEKGGSTREAKAVCANCIVQAECLDYALDHDERFGIWGGLSERERRKIKRRQVIELEPGRHLSGLTCALDGCTQPTTGGDTGRPHKYCTPEHKHLANTNPLNTQQESA